MLSNFALCWRRITSCHQGDGLLIGAWTFNKGLFVLVSPTAMDRSEAMDFCYCSFWVQVHNVSFGCLTWDMAGRIAGVLVGWKK